MSKRHIVFCPVYNNNRNVLFMMNDSDDRLGDGYEAQDEVVQLSTYKAGGVNEAGFKYRVATGSSGQQYHVYSDWSVRIAA